MRFWTVLTPLVLSLSIVAAAPAPSTNASSLVYFKTCIHPGEDASLEGLYLSTYHIGKSLYYPESVLNGPPDMLTV